MKNFEKLDVIQKYFAREFSVLSKKIRKKFLQLNLPLKMKKKVLKELAFLPEHKQEDYLNELEKNKKFTWILVLKILKKELTQLFDDIR